MEGGSITAAVIVGAIISIITLIIGRGSKISEFRQAWVNDQRADFATFGAAALSLAAQRSRDRAADYDKLEAAAYRIRLRENPRKREWASVIAAMEAVRAALIANETVKIDVFDDLKAIGDLAQVRLKKDWNKVRFGEIGYRALILFFPMLFAVLFLLGYYAVFPDQSPFADQPAKPVEQHLSGSVQLIAPPTTAPAPPAVPTPHR